ncbi:MAG: glycine--tRNA ligase subunit beta [Bryobacterales bacterium]|nr:glycine--tRNA ligase subunit beta [Bryobacterales bacterium]
MLPFLLEIGTEEIPDWMIPGALEDLGRLFTDLLAKHGLAHEAITLDATPRRLVLRCAGIAESQPDTESLVTGPPVSAAFKDGEPTPAAFAFAKKMGTDVVSLGRETTAKGEYLAYTRRVEGAETAAILAEALPALILSVHFPKTMVWAGKGSSRFIRPIRWLVALFGDAVVPFSIEGVQSGNRTEGHRRLGAGDFVVTQAGYEALLRENGVILSAAERRKRIVDGAEAVAGAKGLKVSLDPALLETLVYITEFPTPILGAFADEYLSLPEEVLITVMRHHQKYFAVHRMDGSLAPNFVAVMNTASDPEGLVVSGNERVLRARFNDARFFWEFDQKTTLAGRVESLSHVTFHAKLGDYLQKTNRNRERIAKLAELAGVDRTVADRAALLAKCDLTTELVKEFTELQGVVGGLYARHQGEPEEVARAIYDQYKPVSMESEIPATLLGQLLSLADKADTLASCFSIGLIPKGSSDPFALRRAAQGIVRILAEGEATFPLSAFCGSDSALHEFFKDRVRHYFRDVRGYAQDEVSAVMAAGFVDLKDVARRLDAVRDVRPTENFEPIAASFKRIQNILRQAEFAGGAVSDELLHEDAERALHQEFLRVRDGVRCMREEGNYRGALAEIASLRPAVDAFFDQVLVNAKDESVRRNRLGLLHELLTEFSAIADFSEIVTR